MATFSTLLDLLADVPDPRRTKGKFYKLPHVLLFFILAVVSGCNSYRGIVAFIDVHRDLANLGLSLTEAKRLLAGVQREIVAAQARAHTVRRPDCSHCDGVCRVKDYRNHAVATLFGQASPAGRTLDELHQRHSIARCFPA